MLQVILHLPCASRHRLERQRAGLTRHFPVQLLARSAERPPEPMRRPPRRAADNIGRVRQCRDRPSCRKPRGGLSARGHERVLSESGPPVLSGTAGRALVFRLSACSSSWQPCKWRVPPPRMRLICLFACSEFFFVAPHAWDRPSKPREEEEAIAVED